MNIYYHKKIGLDIFGFWRTVGRLVLAFVIAICCSRLLWELTNFHVTWLSISLSIFIIRYWQLPVFSVLA